MKRKLFLLLVTILLSGCQITIVRSGTGANGAWAEKAVITIQPPPIVETYQPENIQWSPEEL